MAKKTRNTRSLIKIAAAQEFAEHGFAGARVERISKIAGVNKQLIFYYFRSKAGLFDAIVRAADEDLAITSRAYGDDREQFRSTFCGMFDSLASSEEMTRILFSRPNTRDSRTSDSTDKMISALSDCVSRGQGLGHYKDDIDPDLVAKQAVILLVGFFATEDTTSSDNGDARKEWLRATSAMLNGWLSW